MVIQELTERECRDMLVGMRVARLACARDNQPYVVPIHVDFDGDYFYGYATLGMKIEWMRQNPLVCLEIDDLSLPDRWASIVVFGRYEELPDTPGHEGSRKMAERLFQTHPMWWEPASVPLGGHERRVPIVYRIGVTRLTGRRASPLPPVRGLKEPVASETGRWGWFGRALRRARPPLR